MNIKEVFINKIIPTLILLWIINAFCYGQADYRTDIIPPSPEAAALGKHGLIPVNFVTGRAGVSIPITELKDGDLSLEIKLSYSSNGFLVKEEASRIGLGWTLNAGGAITRTIQGLPDDEPDNFVSFEEYLNIQYTNPLAINSLFMDSVFLNYYDGQPDIYTFNFNNFTGQFYFVGDKAYTLTKQHMVIEKVNNSFVVTTDDGIKYTFSQKEIIFVNDLRYSSYCSAWYLTEIASADGTDTIQLRYRNAETLLNFLQTNSQYITIRTGGTAPPDYCTGSGQIRDSYSEYSQEQYVLDEIETAQHILKFKEGVNPREDLRGTFYPLASIELIDKRFSGNVIQSWKFTTSYFQNNQNDSYDIKRLKLDGVQEVGRNGFDKPGYLFTYNEEKIFPLKSSYGIDTWGYYNGKPNTTFLPPTKIIGTIYGTADRNPDASYGITGMLTRIQYPTGGNTQFVYEQNEHGNFLEEYESIDRQKTVTSTNTNATNNAIVDSKAFNLNTDQEVILYYQLEASVPFALDEQLYPQVTIRKFDLALGIDEIAYQFILNLNSSLDEKSIELNLVAGNYRLEVGTEAGYTSAFAHLNYIEETPNLILSKPAPGLRIKKIISNTVSQSIKKNYSYQDPENGNKSTGVYYHEMQGRSIFRRFMLVPFDPLAVSADCLDCELTTVTSESASGFGSLQRHKIAYNKVYEAEGTEIVDGQGSEIIESNLTDLDKLGIDYFFSNGWKRYHYYVSGNSLTYEDLLLNEDEFKVDLGGVQVTVDIIRNRHNDYEEVLMDFENDAFDLTFSHFLPTVEPELYEQNECMGVVVGGNKHTNRNKQLTRKWYKLLQNTHTDIASAGSIEKRTTYGYNDQQYANYIAETYGSKVQTTRLKYASDYNMLMTNALINAGINPIIEKQVWVKTNLDSLFVAGVVNEFDIIKLKPKKRYVFRPSQAVTALTEIESNGKYLDLIPHNDYKISDNLSYDSEGRIISSLSQDDIFHTYLWDEYNRIVAKVENATPNQVFYTGFEDGSTDAFYLSGKNSVTTSYSIPSAGLPSVAGDYVLAYFKYHIAKGQWIQELEEINGYTPGDPIQVGGGLSGKIDDVLIYPKGAVTNIYGYDIYGNLNLMIDTNGVFNEYGYDAFNRLRTIKDHKEDILKILDYNYFEE